MGRHKTQVTGDAHHPSPTPGAGGGRTRDGPWERAASSGGSLSRVPVAEAGGPRAGAEAGRTAKREAARKQESQTTAVSAFPSRLGATEKIHGEQMVPRCWCIGTRRDLHSQVTDWHATGCGVDFPWHWSAMGELKALPSRRDLNSTVVRNTVFGGDGRMRSPLQQPRALPHPHRHWLCTGSVSFPRHPATLGASPINEDDAAVVGVHCGPFLSPEPGSQRLGAPQEPPRSHRSTCCVSDTILSQ